MIPLAEAAPALQMLARACARELHNTQLRAVSWVERGRPEPDATDANVVITEALSVFRKAACNASTAELDRFLDLSVVEGWRHPVADAA